MIVGWFHLVRLDGQRFKRGIYKVLGFDSDFPPFTHRKSFKLKLAISDHEQFIVLVLSTYLMAILTYIDDLISKKRIKT
jgi:hypothetical protein